MQLNIFHAWHKIMYQAEQGRVDLMVADMHFELLINPSVKLIREMLVHNILDLLMDQITDAIVFWFAACSEVL